MKTGIKGLIAGSVALTALATGFIQPWEGRELRAYYDIVGVLTICDGDTFNVKPGQVATHAECDSRLARHLVTFEGYLDKCLTAAVPAKVKVAFLSWIYNVGPGNACHVGPGGTPSTLIKKANAGDLIGACNQLLVWNRAGGKVVRGLKNRREAERQLCLEGVAEGVK